LTKKKPIFVVGTRPELIKVAPIYDFFKKEGLEPQLILTNQQGTLVSSLLPWFGIDDAINLPSPREDSLAGKFWEISRNLTNFLAIQSSQPWVFAQGDTTTVAASSLTAFYSGRKFAHLEAGLRCETPWLPYPEEGNRRIASQVATLNFAPTLGAAENLSRFGIEPSSIFVVGNTGIDALLASVKRLQEKGWKSLYLSDRTKILVTLHRRESFGKPLREACRAIKFLAENYNVEIIWPVHSNPKVKETIFAEISGVENIRLVEPLNYPNLVSALNDCDFVLTDSGGIQEEAPALSKPVLVLRNETERTELIEQGGGILVGTNFEKIVNSAHKLIHDSAFLTSMKLKESPFGDGASSARILEVFEKHDV
jgi:UDP-N-acetylglucosamine 2-epimerase (non-hydrolysing)